MTAVPQRSTSMLSTSPYFPAEISASNAPSFAGSIRKSFGVPLGQSLPAPLSCANAHAPHIHKTRAAAAPAFLKGFLVLEKCASLFIDSPFRDDFQSCSEVNRRIG